MPSTPSGHTGPQRHARRRPRPLCKGHLDDIMRDSQLRSTKANINWGAGEAVRANKGTVDMTRPGEALEFFTTKEPRLVGNLRLGEVEWTMPEGEFLDVFISAVRRNPK